MQQINIAAVANQNFSVQLNNILYNLTIKLTVNVMSVSISRNGSVVQSGARAVSGFPLIPYHYQEDGNFIITTENNDYPDYSKFGISQFLIYASQDELEVIRGN